VVAYAGLGKRLNRRNLALLAAPTLVFGLLFIHSPLHRWPVALILGGHLVLRLVYLLGAVRWWPSWPLEPMILA